MESADKQALDSLLSDRLSYGHSDGKVEDKKAFITHLESGAYDFVKITISDQAITVSANTAIVRHTLSASTNDNGKPGQVKLHVMQVWQKHKGKWLLLARQATKI